MQRGALHLIGATALLFASVLSALAQAPSPDPALRGHGGPIRSIAVLDEKTVVTGGFDAAIIVWDIPSGTATRVLRLHDGAVTVLVADRPGCFASGGEDGRIDGWCPQLTSRFRMNSAVITPSAVHGGPVTAFVRDFDKSKRGQDGRELPRPPNGSSPNGDLPPSYSSSWDRSVWVWEANPNRNEPIAEHRGPVNGLGIVSAGIVSASYDGEVRITGRDRKMRRQMQLPAALNGLVVLKDERLALAAADGRVRVLNPDLTPSFEIELPEGPLMAIAVSPDGKMIATAGMRTPVALIDVETRALARRIHGPGLPIWALAFSTDSRELFTGGADRALRRFNVATGEPVGAPIAKPGDTAGPLSNEPGALVFRACAVCHTLRPEEGHRAGPTLHGIMGRRIATTPGYDYSEALKKMDIVWTPETIAKLFEVGPTAYTPGTKMPEQRVTNADDRRALVEWLAKVTK